MLELLCVLAGAAGGATLTNAIAKRRRRLERQEVEALARALANVAIFAARDLDGDDQPPAISRELELRPRARRRCADLPPPVRTR